LYVFSSNWEVLFTSVIPRTESQKGSGWKGSLEITYFNPSTQGGSAGKRLSGTTSSWVFIICTAGESLTSLGNLSQCLTILTVKKVFLSFSCVISFTYSEVHHCNIPRQLSITGNVTKIHWLLVSTSWRVHNYINIPHYITTPSSFLLVSSVVRLISYNASVQFQVLLTNMFFTALNSMQSLVKDKYNYWCDNRSLILYSFMLSEQVKRATKDEKQYRFRYNLFSSLSFR